MKAILAAQLALVVSLLGCSSEPATVSISTTLHNYSADDVLTVSVGGKTAGSLADPAAPGRVTGGGVVCCIRLPTDKRHVEVTIRAVDNRGTVSNSTVHARVRQPWPDIASYAVFNVLPGRRVLVEIVPTYLIPHGDRLSELERAWAEAG